MTVQIDKSRLRESFDQYSSIGETENGGLHRLALSEADKRVRDQFVSDLEDLDVTIRIDEVGNIFGRQRGTFEHTELSNLDPVEADTAGQRGTFEHTEPVLIGSHLDSQPYGGRYDGQLGVLLALETMRAFEEQDIEQTRPLEIVNWTNEEGSRFNLAPLGSGVFVGEYDVDTALETTDSEGVTVKEALAEIGYDGETDCESHAIDSHLELHIEQGPELMNKNASVGVVDGVSGMSWFRVTVEGEANHAGTTPMYARRDALSTAVSAIDTFRSLPAKMAADSVLTVGTIETEPDSINVIPGAVQFTIDLRSPDDETRNEIATEIERVLEYVTDQQGTSYTIEEIFSTNSTTFSPDIRQLAKESCEETGISFEEMTSGAGHDAMYLNNIAETAMLFVPSVNGVSHREDEHTEWSDVLSGAQVFAETTRKLALS